MSINDALDSVILKRSDESMIGSADDDDFFRPPRPKRDDDLEMDITPMIDITFLLLIFFLVTSTPDETTVLALPRAHHGDAVSQIRSTVISVGEGGFDSAPVFTGDGKVKANELPTDLEERKRLIKEYVLKGLEDENKTDVVVKGDRGVLCRDIDNVLKAISQVEGIKLNLAVLETR